MPERQGELAATLRYFTAEYDAAPPPPKPINNFQVVVDPKTEVRAARKRALKAYFDKYATDNPNGHVLEFHDWVVEIEDASPVTDSYGTETAYLSVRFIGSPVTLETPSADKGMNEAMLKAATDFDAESQLKYGYVTNKVGEWRQAPNTTIPKGSDMYNTVTMLKKGDRVRVSGVFLVKSDGNDYLDEGSLTESGSMDEPEFFVRFTSIATGTNASAPTNVSVSTPATAVVQPVYSGEGEQNSGPTTNAPMSTPATGIVQPAYSGEGEQNSGPATQARMNARATAVVQPPESQPSTRPYAVAISSPQPVPTTQAVAPTALQAVPEPAAAPAPVPLQPSRELVVPAGTTLVVRMSNSLTSKTAKIGDSFTGTLAQSVAVNGVVAIPSGTGVSGSVSDIKSPGRFKGQGILTITLNSISIRGVPITIATSTYGQTVKGKGERTAVAVGGGSGVGALIGGLAGGGKGAGIGALIGGGAGTAGAVFTGNKELEIPAESVVTFKLVESITVRHSALTQ